MGSEGPPALSGGPRPPGHQGKAAQRLWLRKIWGAQDRISQLWSLPPAPADSTGLVKNAGLGLQPGLTEMEPLGGLPRKSTLSHLLPPAQVCTEGGVSGIYPGPACLPAACL